MTSTDLQVALLRTAGVVQIGIVAANFSLPRKLGYRENLERVSPIIRQIFIVHTVYILFVLILFSGACLLFAPELAAGTGLGRYLSGVLSFFWASRALVQLRFYDRDIRRQNRGLDVAFIAALCFLVVVFAAAALGSGR